MQHEKTQQDKTIIQKQDQAIEEIQERLKQLANLPYFQRDASQAKPQQTITTDTGIKPSPSTTIPETKLVEEEKVPEEPALKPPLVKKGLFYIQVGLFTVREYAHSTLDKFKQRGYEGIVIPPSTEDGSKYYRVVVGGYEDREEAVKKKLELEKSDNASYYVIQY